MSFKVNTSAKLKTVFIAAITGAVIGTLFTCIAFGFDIERAIKGFIAGAVISFLSALFEKFVFEVKFKKLNFSFVVLFRTLVYIIIISFSVLMVWIVHESLINSRGFVATVRTDDFRNFLTGVFPYIFTFAFTISFFMNFMLQINGLLGRGVLLSYVTGKYHKPKIEKRFFMFLDLESSTTIAETIGPLRYHEFMNSYFYDINDPIIASKGEIYQYVGDEVVISWKGSNGIKNSNCIKCFFDISDKIASLQESYIKKFGILPGFKAGVHFGEVVIGEVGDSRKEIVFQGDVMNTTSRIQGQSKILNKQLLISGEALGYLKPDRSFIIENMGSFKLKGKENQIEIFNISKA